MDSYYEGMVVRLRSRPSWVFCIVGIIAMGILSRVVHTGLAVFDKHLGDALYAMMVYGILRLLSRAAASAVCAMVINDRDRVVSTDNDSGPHACE